MVSSSILAEKYVIDPLKLGAPAQVGYDLTVCAIKPVYEGGVLPASGKTTIIHGDDITRFNNAWMLHPGVYSMTFDQGIDLAISPLIGGYIIHRSSLARMGAMITSGIYDPGFRCDQIGAVIHVAQRITIAYRARVAQFVGILAHGTPPLYDGQFQGNKDIK